VTIGLQATFVAMDSKECGVGSTDELPPYELPSSSNPNNQTRVKWANRVYKKISNHTAEQMFEVLLNRDFAFDLPNSKFSDFYPEMLSDRSIWV
jgi:hypothetical protein